MEKVAFGVILLFACLSLGFTAEHEEVLGEATLDPKKSMVALFNMCDTHRKAKCLGILIANNYILTAAHCVYGSTCLKVQLGKGKYADEADKHREIEKAIIHPFYIHGSPDYDVAVLKIKPFDDAEVIFQLPDFEPYPNSKIQIGGWSTTEMEFELLPGTLIDRKTCQRAHNQIVITSRLICIENSFSYNSGGYPVFLISNDEYYLVGIATSRGQNQLSTPLFANLQNSEILSFVETYYTPTTKPDPDPGKTSF